MTPPNQMELPMQSLVCMLSRVFRWPSHMPLHRLPADQARVAESEVGCTIYTENDPTTRQPETLFTQSTGPLRVKWHRDNVLDRTPFPTRLVISGRMADVHAELERLAAMETMA